MKYWKTPIGEYSIKLNRLLKSKKYHYRKCNSEVVPREKGIYVIYKKEKKAPIYVGITTDLKRRLFHQHLKATGSQFATYCRRITKIRGKKGLSKYIENNCYFRFMPYDSKKLRWLEHFAVAVLRPKWMKQKVESKDE